MQAVSLGRCGTGLLCLGALLLCSAPLRAQAAFRRGDANSSGAVDISDAIHTLTFLFVGGGEILCDDAADTNDSGVVDLSDPVFSLNFLFTGGAAPPPPGVLSCGLDPTEDALSCLVSPTCGNAAPVAAFEVHPRAGLGPLEVTLDATASTDADGRIVSYTWDLGDGTRRRRTGPAPFRHTYVDVGEHTVRLVVTDDRGASGEASAIVSISDLAPLGIVATSPADGEAGVAVTRETIVELSGRIAPASLSEDAFLGLFAGRRLPARIHLSRDRTHVTLFWATPLPPSARVQVRIDGDLLRDDLGRAIDADGDGVPGGAASLEFDTLGLSLVPGTSVCGRVFASEPSSEIAGDFVNRPLEGVSITIDGVPPPLASAATDALGNFRLEPAPSGRFFVHIDGRTVTQSLPPGAYYPFVGKTWEAVTGEDTNVGDVFLPLVRPGTLQVVSDDEETTVCFSEAAMQDLPPAFEDVCLSVPAGALFSDDGTRGGRVGIAPVDPERLPGTLPPGLEFSLVITVQTDGATNFDEPAPICFPNLPHAVTGVVRAPGEETALWSFDHDRGEWNVVGSMTVSEDGRLVCTDPGVGILAPGWHGVQDGVRADGGRRVDGNDDERATPCVQSEATRGAGRIADDSIDDDCIEGQELVHDGEPSEADCLEGLRVHLQTGEEHFERIDLEVPGRGDIHFTMRRTYRSRLSYDGPLGHGWDHDYNDALFPQANGDVVRKSGTGHLARWIRRQDGGFEPPRGYFGTLVRQPDGTFVLREVDGFKRRYDRDGRLEAHIDRHGNSMLFDRDERGRLDLVVDVYGREYEFFHEAGADGVSRLRRIRDFTGREVIYTHDARGDLVAVRTPVVTGTSTGNDFPEGRTESYTYSSGFADDALNHNIVSLTYPEEHANGGPPAITWVHGTNPADPLTLDRVLEEHLGGGRANASGVPAGGVLRFEYATLNAEAPAGQLALPRGRVTVTERNGNVYQAFANERGHHILTRRFTRGLRRDDEGNPLEPEFYETRSFFDEDGQLTRRVYPQGNELRLTYDTSGPRVARRNVIERRLIADPERGGGEDLVWRYTYEPLYQQLASVTTPRGNASGFTPPIGVATAERYTLHDVFDYQEGDAPIPEASVFGIDLSGIARGLGDLNNDGRIDQHVGNVVLAELPAVLLEPDSRESARLGSTTQRIRTENVWNDRGQPISSTDAEGNVTTFSYYPENDPDGDGNDVFSMYVSLSPEEGTGYLRETIVDARDSPRRTSSSPPARLRTVQHYDPVGNRTAVVDPRGIVSTWERNALNEPVVHTRAADISEAINAGTLLVGDRPLAYRERHFFDHNGRVVRVEVENRDGPPGDPDPASLGAFVEEIFVHDILDNLVEARKEVDGTTMLSWSQRYDENELLIVSRQPEGNETRIEYDERNLPFRVTRGAGTPEASTFRIDHDANGQRLRILDAEDNDGDGQPESTRFFRDGFDRLTRVVDALGNETLLTLDPDSNIVRTRHFGHPPGDPTGANVLLLDVRSHHDELQRVYRVDTELFVADGFSPARAPSLLDDDGDGRVTQRTEFDALSRVSFLRDDDDDTSSFRYDGVGRLVEEIDPFGNRELTEYDANSNPIRTVEIEVATDELVAAEVFTTTRVHDQLDRLVRTSDSLGHTRRIEYDSRDQPILVSDAEGAPVDDALGLVTGTINLPGNTTRKVYDGLGREIRVQRELRAGGTGDGALITSVVESFRHDGNSRLVASVDDNGNETRYEYDSLDRQIVVRLADGTTRLTRFDRDDNPVETVDANGTVTRHSFDALDRLTRVEVTRAPGVEGTRLQTFEYDGLSRLVASHDDNGDATREQRTESVFDSLSRVIEERQNAAVVSSVLAGDGRRIACTYPGGRRVEWTHDALDRPVSVRDAAGEIARLAWIGPGLRELERVLGNGVVETRLDASRSQDIGHDAARRLVRSRCLSPAGVAFVDREYTYNREHHRSSERRLDDEGLTDRFTLDSLHRIVVTELDRDGSAQATPRETSRRSYDLDGAGNRLSVEKESPGGATTTVAYDVNSLNEYTSVDGTTQLHDANGNLIDDGVRLYAYDFRDRLVHVRDRATGATIARYDHDAENRRRRKDLFADGEPTGSTLYHHDGWNVVEESDASGTTRLTVVHAPQIDDVIQIERSAAHALGASTLWLHQNARLDVVAVTDINAVVLERTRYDDYGMVDRSSSTGSPFGFQGRRLDTETGLHYFRHRYYSSETGRFLQRDSAWDAVNLGNLYSFVGNSPASRRDPLGLRATGSLADSAFALAQRYERRSKLIAPCISRGVAMLFSWTLDFVPYVGTAKGIYEAITGEDILTGLRKSTAERIFGALGGLKHAGKLLRVAGSGLGRAGSALSKGARALRASSRGGRIAARGLRAARGAARAGRATLRTAGNVTRSADRLASRVSSVTSLARSAGEVAHAAVARARHALGNGLRLAGDRVRRALGRAPIAPPRPPSPRPGFGLAVSSTSPAGLVPESLGSLSESLLPHIDQLDKPEKLIDQIIRPAFGDRSDVGITVPYDDLERSAAR